MTIKTIFLDRDGIVNKDVRYLYKIKDFEFIDGIFEACLCFHNLGYQIIIDILSLNNVEKNWKK